MEKHENVFEEESVSSNSPREAGHMMEQDLQKKLLKNKGKGAGKDRERALRLVQVPHL